MGNIISAAIALLKSLGVAIEHTAAPELLALAKDTGLTLLKDALMFSIDALAAAKNKHIVLLNQYHIDTVGKGEIRDGLKIVGNDIAIGIIEADIVGLKASIAVLEAVTNSVVPPTEGTPTATS